MKHKNVNEKKITWNLLYVYLKFSSIIEFENNNLEPIQSKINFIHIFFFYILKINFS